MTIILKTMPNNKPCPNL